MGEMKKLNYSWAFLFSLVKVMFFKDDAATTIIGSKQLLYILQTHIFRQYSLICVVSVYFHFHSFVMSNDHSNFR